MVDRVSPLFQPFKGGPIGRKRSNYTAPGHNKLPFRSVSACSSSDVNSCERARRNWSPSAVSTSTLAAVAAPFRKSTSGNGRRPRRPRWVVRLDVGPYGCRFQWEHVIARTPDFCCAVGSWPRRSLTADRGASFSTRWRERARTVTDDRYIIFATGLRASRFTVLAGCWTRLSLRAA